MTAREAIAAYLAEDIPWSCGSTTGASGIADSILSALDKADFCVVPKEPTRAMLRACLEELRIEADKKATDILDHLDISKAADAVSCYRAMLSASAKEEGKG